MSNAKQLIFILNRLTNFSGRMHINIIKAATHNPDVEKKKIILYITRYVTMHVTSELQCTSGS